MKHENVKKMVALALLAALVVVLQTVASGIRVGPVPITLTLVPIVIGAILYGPAAGAGLGAIFGLVTAVAGLTGTDQGTQALIQASPFWTLATCFVKAASAGWISGLIYRALRKKQTLGCILAAIAAPIVNTGVFLLAMTTVLRTSLEAWAGGTDMVYYIFVVLTGVNFLVEFGVNAVLSVAIARIVQVVENQNGKQHGED